MKLNTMFDAYNVIKAAHTIEQSPKKGKTICLNMIVKNEFHILKDTFDKLLKKIQIDYWVISDTGSTDGTQNLIRTYFAAKGIPGELNETAWRDFGYNRTVAFQKAYKKSDYVFVWDADDEICGDFHLPETLDADSYMFGFGDHTGVSYWRPQMFKNSLQWEYHGVLHEYAECKEPSGPSFYVHGNYYFVSGRSGARNKNPNKLLDDAVVLEKAYYESFEKNDNIFHRYAFYCARSYYESGKNEKAIEFFKKVLTYDMPQEKYISCKLIYNCYKHLNMEEEGLGFLVQAYQHDTTRVECIYHLVAYYAHKQLYNIAYMYYKLIQDYYENRYERSHLSSKLFTDNDLYEFMLPYFMIIVAQRCGENKTCAKMCEMICKHKFMNVGEFHIANWIHNMQFFIEHMPNSTRFIDNFLEYLDSLEKKGIIMNENNRNIISKIVRRVMNDGS